MSISEHPKLEAVCDERPDARRAVITHPLYDGNKHKDVVLAARDA